MERIAIVFSYHGQLAGIDNNFPYPVMCLLKKLSIYPDPENYPFAVNPYAPALFYISYAVCTVFGVNAGDTIQIYFVTRGVCLVSDLMTIYILYRVMRKYFTISKPTACLAVLCFFYLISYWGYTMNRSDSLLLLCFTAIVSYILSYLEKGTGYKLIITALFCNLAIFSKQNAIITPAVVGAILLYCGNWKAFFTFLLSFSVFFTGFLFLFSNLYPGGTFFDHLFKALHNQIDPRWFYINIFKRLIAGFVIIPLAAGIFMAIQWILKGTSLYLACLSLTVIITACWATVISFKWGSGVSYFHETLLCITILLAYAADKTDISLFIKRLSYLTLFTLLFIFSHILLELFFFDINDRSADRQTYLQQKQVSDALLTELGESDRYVFANTDHTNDFFKSLLQGKAAAPNQDAVSCCTYPDKNFDYSILKEGFLNGKIAFIIFTTGHISSSFFDISFSRYEYYKTINNYVIYRFKG
jgi:hypothetical protein